MSGFIIENVQYRSGQKNGTFNAIINKGGKINV